MTWPFGVQEALFDGAAYSVDRSLVEEPWIPDSLMSDDDAWSIIDPDERRPIGAETLRLLSPKVGEQPWRVVGTAELSGRGR